MIHLIAIQRMTVCFNTGLKIPLYAVDVFWRKLDFKPESVEPQEIDIDKEIEQVKQHIVSQPPAVKKSMLSKIKAVIYPQKSEKKPPVVKQQTRGRPTTKQTEQRKADAARKSNASRINSITPSQQQTNEDASYDGTRLASQLSRFDAGRHSSYISSADREIPSSVDRGKKPVMQRSRSTASKKSVPRNDHGFPLIVDDA